MSKFNSRAFWLGFIDGLSTFSLSLMAFAAVWRRALKGDFPAVTYDVRMLWWTPEEVKQRAERVLHAWADDDQYDGMTEFRPWDEEMKGPLY